MHTTIQTHDLCDTGAVLYQLHELSSQLDGGINPVLVSFSAVKIYDLSYTHLYSSLYTGILRTYKVTSSQMA